MKQKIINLIKKQKEFFESGITFDINFRVAQLRKIKNLLKENENEIYSAIDKDFNKSKFETFVTELSFIYQEIKLAEKKIKKWSKPTKVKTSIQLFKSKSKIMSEPYGVSLIIGAWNYPFQLTIVPLISAIAAGNCVILKPSELSSKSSKIIEKIFNNNFSENYIKVVGGGVKETSLLLKQDLDMIFFTGSTRVGQIVMQAAAKKLIPVVLELGGKSPCIVDKNVNLKVTAKRIVWGKFINAGQTCIAPDYLIVHKDMKEKLLKEIEKVIKQFYGDDPEKSNDYAKIVNEQHFNRLTNLMKNGTIYYGGKIKKRSRYISPTIITDINLNFKIMKEEIFGPLLPVLEFSEISDIFGIIKDNPKPLSLYLFTNNKQIKNVILKNISFGGGCVNTTLMHIANHNLPFGGIGFSGIGNYHGKYGFDTFSHKKSILKKSFKFETNMIYPPYKNKLNLVKKILK